MISKLSLTIDSGDVDARSLYDLLFRINWTGSHYAETNSTNMQRLEGVPSCVLPFVCLSGVHRGAVVHAPSRADH